MSKYTQDSQWQKGIAQELSLQQFDDQAATFDSVVEKNGGSYCSSSSWQIPALRAFSARGVKPLILRYDDTYLFLAHGLRASGHWVLTPFEASWGLGCPIAGDPEKGVSLLKSVLYSRSIPWNYCLLCGIEPGSILARLLLKSLEQEFALRVHFGTPRFVSSLEGGLDAFLSRRSKNFRRSVKKARTRGEEAEVYFEVGDDNYRDPKQYLRIQTIERQSWKGKQDAGISAEPMLSFYKHMLQREGDFRVAYARLGQKDIGYILGVVFAGQYRGLQFAFADEYRALSVGTLMQLHEIQRLVKEGVTSYDLGGTGVSYKTRWSDQIVPSAALVIENPIVIENP